MRYHQDRDRFPYYHEIEAKYDGTATACGKKDGGHAIKKGDAIGYNPATRPSKTMCADCWAAWIAENREADMAEAGGCW